MIIKERETPFSQVLHKSIPRTDDVLSEGQLAALFLRGKILPQKLFRGAVAKLQGDKSASQSSTCQVSATLGVS